MHCQFGTRRPLVGLQDRRGVFVTVVAGIVAQREAWPILGFRLAEMRLRKGFITRVGPKGREDAPRSPAPGHGGGRGDRELVLVRVRVRTRTGGGQGVSEHGELT